MRARFINENTDDIFKPKDKDDITLQAFKTKGAKKFTLKDGKTVWVYKDHFTTLASPMVLKIIDEQGKKYFSIKNFDFKDEDKKYLKNWELSESHQIFKPKSHKDILTDLNKEFDTTMYELENGNKIWVYANYIKDMGGEWIPALLYLDEKGFSHFLSDQIIQMVKNPIERQKLYKWDDSF
jgi:hypothetical protein